jgi:hypothetical protein
MLDFSLIAYKTLLVTLKNQGYTFITFEQYIEFKSHKELPAKFVILRHDVDDLAHNSLRFAKIQSELDIVGTYYFRIVPQSYDINIMELVADLEHEVGYHYETMDTSSGDIDLAFREFKMHLNKFQSFLNVKTISMHGSPMSKYDNRDLWKKYDYRKLGIIGEPYFDFDFNEAYYITDTGRAWNGHRYNIRDRAPKENPVTNKQFLGLNYSSTFDIITAIESGTFPEKVMMNFHPERWTDNRILWVKQLVKQRIKNQIKRIIIFIRR